MNNRRKQLMLASAKEYCKCVVEGKTIKYNQLLETNLFANVDSSSLLNIFNVIANHKYIFIQKYSRESEYPYEDRDYQVYFYGDNIEAEYNINVRGNFIYEPNANDTCTLRIQTYSEFGTPLNFSIMLIDLTTLGLTNVNSVADFFATDLGKYIAKGNYLPYETEGKFINATSPIYFKGRNMLSLARTQGTLSGFANTTPRDFKENEYYLGLTMNNYYNNYTTYFEISREKVVIETSGSGYGVAFPIKVKQNTNYKLKFDATDNRYRIGWYNELGEFLSYNYNITGNFTSPNNAYWGVLVLGPSNTNRTTYTNIIFCEVSDYQNKYEPYCSTQVFENGLTLQNGDKYKSWGLDEISYNNLIPNANQDYANSNADTRANIILSVYDYTNNIDVFAEGISAAGFYEFTFTSNTTTYFGAKIYNSGFSINQNFAENISLTNGHLYYMSLNISSCDASFVGGLRIANLRLIDLTQLGLNNVPQKLGLFLKQNYRLPVSSSNRTIKVQIVRTFKEVDLSSFTWNNVVGVYYVALPKDIKLNGQAIAEKYANDDIWIAEYPYDDMNLIVRTNATPSGKALLELETQEINVWYHLEINDYHDFEQYSGTIYKLDRDLSDLNVFSVTADIGNNMGSLFFLDGRGNYNDYCYENGYIYVKSDDIENAWAFDLLINNLPNRMTSRRIINVESKNGIDLDFSKE